MLQSLFFNNIFSFLEVRIMRYNKTFEVYKLCTFKKLFIYSLALIPCGALGHGSHGAGVYAPPAPSAPPPASSHCPFRRKQERAKHRKNQELIAQTTQSINLKSSLSLLQQQWPQKTPEQQQQQLRQQQQQKTAAYLQRKWN